MADEPQFMTTRQALCALACVNLIVVDRRTSQKKPPRPAPPYAKYEEADIASAGVISGRARPPHSADDSVNLPRASVPPEVSIRPVLLRLPPRLASGGLHIHKKHGKGAEERPTARSFVARAFFCLSCLISGSGYVYPSLV